MALSCFLGQGHSCFSQERLQLDLDDSNISFRIKHMGVLTVEGRFREAEGSMFVTENRPVRMDCEVTSASVDTQNSSRDATLRETAYLDAENFPTITFDSEEIASNTIFGTLTIKGVARAIEVPYTWEEKMLRAKFEIDRENYGLDFGRMDGLIGKQISVELTLVFGNH
ncbi:MAG: YceI family protein [Bacteroidota bacterium]